MSVPLVVTLPAGGEALREEITQQLTPYAEVSEAPASFAVAEIALIVGIASGSVQIIEFLLKLKERFRKEAKPSGIQIGPLGKPSIALEQADEHALRQMIVVEAQANAAENNK